MPEVNAAVGIETKSPVWTRTSIRPRNKTLRRWVTTSATLSPHRVSLGRDPAKGCHEESRMFCARFSNSRQPSLATLVNEWHGTDNPPRTTACQGKTIQGAKIASVGVERLSASSSRRDVTR